MRPPAGRLGPTYPFTFELYFLWSAEDELSVCDRCVLCLPDEGLSGAGAAAEGRGDRAASDGAADAGDREGASVTG